MAARVPISAADVARLLEAMGVDRVVAVDLHCGQIQGFFGPRVPVDNLQGGVVGVDYFAQMDLQKPVIVSPDAGGVYRVKKFRDGMMTKHGIDAGVAMIIKQRGKPGQIDSMDLVGNIEDCDCIIVDDAQSFRPEWLEALPAALTATGRLYILSDSYARVFEDREPIAFDADETLYVTLDESLRVPQRQAEELKA